ncbi:hypothetical protein GGTG_02581 [Gaeumannomyces tritici R3-111a-1]|uniref:Uncharacterized protein n=1 Tax=Gaeumannomyces tritici (strain R3-111a-1) TaxID=644352 RepID=J3NMS5_GAET3|nr:hypothetical protein GGTG_02581 [Gaeumannomyces tritici R3-111a-1]EJT82608.1 hypothetical protein GGTG_02581 [Gaeumannomyces tritici R3-111a-1]
MYLVNVETKKLERFGGAEIPKYAILSHTWGEASEELTFTDISKGNVNKPGVGADKFQGCCRLATGRGVKYVWIDTCCINKGDGEELREAINSMFRWYRDAEVCLVFLADVPPGDDPKRPQSKFSCSRWFTRGWTLQELLAPSRLVFYGSGWDRLGTKADFCSEIERITSIPRRVLNGDAKVQDTSVAQRMSWAASRNTTREEDLAYCLLGIFDVVLPMLYGVGHLAFRQLQEAIMRKTRDDSILAWGFPTNKKGRRLPAAATRGGASSSSGGVLATGPSGFAGCGDISGRERSAGDTLDVRGGSLSLRIRLYTLPTTGETFCLLECGPESDKSKVVGIPLVAVSGEQPREQPREFVRLEGRHAKLIHRSAAAEAAGEFVYIACEPRPSLAQGCWFRVSHPGIPGLRLVEVTPPCRGKFRNDIRNDIDLIRLVAAPDQDGPPRTLARFQLCHGGETAFPSSRDFVVVLRGEPSWTSKGRAQCHVMTASRDTPMEDIGQRFADMRPEALGAPSASNGELSIQVALERAANLEPIVRLTRLHHPPAVTVDATSELEYLAAARLVSHNGSGEPSVGVLLGGGATAGVDADPDATRADDRGRTLLYRAVAGGRDDIVRTLLSRDLDVVAEEDDWPSLHLASWYGQEAVVQLLLDQGVNPAAERENGWTALHVAAARGQRGVAQVLLSRQADAKAKSTDGWTPPGLAVRYGQAAVLELLLDADADADAVADGEGWFPLHIAAEHGHEAVAALLLRRRPGADIPNMTNGQRPLHRAAANGHEGVARLLIDRNASTGARDRCSQTPLHLAAANGRETTVRLLLERGADAAARGNDNQTPLDLAVGGGCEATQRLLERAPLDERRETRTRRSPAARSAGVVASADRPSPTPAPLYLLKTTVRFASSSLILSGARGQMEAMVRRLELGNEESARRVSQMWVAVLKPLMSSRNELVDAIFKQCANDLRRTINHGELSGLRPTIRAGIEFALSVVETGNRAMVASVLEDWVPLLDYALEKHRPDAEEIIAGVAGRFDLSTSPNRKEAETLTLTVFLALERALREGQEKVKLVNCLVRTIRTTLRDKVPKDPALCADWIEALFVRGTTLQLPQVLLKTGTGLLGLTNPEGEMELFEGTVAEVVRWLLWEAHATNRLDHATELIVDLVKKSVAEGGGAVVRDREIVRRIFLLTAEHLDFVEPDNSIREALLTIFDEMRRMP